MGNAEQLALLRTAINCLAPFIPRWRFTWQVPDQQNTSQWTVAHGDQLRRSGVTGRRAHRDLHGLDSRLAGPGAWHVGHGGHVSPCRLLLIGVCVFFSAHVAQLNIRIPTRPFLEIPHAGQASHARIHDAIIIHHLPRSKIVSRRSQRTERTPVRAPRRGVTQRSRRSASDSANTGRSCISPLHRSSRPCWPCWPCPQHATVITMASSGPPRSHDFFVRLPARAPQ